MTTYYKGRELAPGEVIPCACCGNPYPHDTAPRLQLVTGWVSALGGYCPACYPYAGGPVVKCVCDTAILVAARAMAYG